MLNALDRYFPDSFKWSKPDGGMFLWAQGPKGMDMEMIYREGVKRGVAFVPGKYFFTRQGEGEKTMRLNFTMCDEDTIDHAIKVLSGIVKEELKKCSL